MGIRKSNYRGEPEATIFEGHVLRAYENSDSLFERYSSMADVFNPKTGQVEAVSYGGGYWGERHNGNAAVDASPAVRAQAYASEYARVLPLELNKLAAEVIGEAKGKAFGVQKGVTAKVVRGRKVPVGTEGTVIWTGSGQYGDRVGIKDAAGEVHWTALSNVERTDSDVWDYLPDTVRGVEHLAKRRAAEKAEFTTGHAVQVAA